METNEENRKYYIQEHEKHLSEGGKMPVECAITNLVFKAIKEKNYAFLKNSEDTKDIKFWDVVAYTTVANDVIFGVLTETDGNVFYVMSGTENGIIREALEL